MYGLIGNIKSVPGHRDELAEILLGVSNEMPGCLSYVVAIDPNDPDGIWVSEVWVDEESHTRSLQVESVQTAIARGRPLMAGFDSRIETVPLGGFGLPPAT